MDRIVLVQKSIYSVFALHITELLPFRVGIDYDVTLERKCVIFFYLFDMILIRLISSTEDNSN